MSETKVVRYRGEYLISHSFALHSLPCDDLETSCKGDIRIFIFYTVISYYIFLQLTVKRFQNATNLCLSHYELSGKQYVLVDIIQLFSDI